MGLNSNNCEDVAKWIETVINSCENQVQLSVAANLVKLFLEQLKEEFPELHSHYSLHLNKCLTDKF